jgi:hypothetical protein
MSDLARRCCSTAWRFSRTLDSLVDAAWSPSSRGRRPDTRRIAHPCRRKGYPRRRAHWARAQTQVAHKLGRVKLDALIATLGEVEALHPDPGGRER